MDTSRRSGISLYYKSSVPSAYTFVLLDGLASPWVLPAAAVPCESGSPYFRLVQDALATVGSKTLPGIAIAECRSPFKLRGWPYCDPVPGITRSDRTSDLEKARSVVRQHNGNTRAESGYQACRAGGTQGELESRSS
ncbi:g1307 [Coccomyxa elongata]